MTTNEKKAKVQAEANAAIDANGGFGLIAMATGVGKSKVGVDRAIKVFTSCWTTEYKPRILLVVPTEKLRDEGWKDEFIKWKCEPLYDKIERTCYASLHNYSESEDYDLVILDECHNITEHNSIFFHDNTVKSCIGLTATKSKDLIKVHLLSKILHVDTHRNGEGKTIITPTYEITLDQGIKMGLVAPYEITIVTMKLNTVDKYIKTEYTDKQSKQKKVFSQTEAEQYNYLTRQVNFGTNPLRQIKRKNFIYSLKSKTEIAKKILEYVIPQDIRTLIFCGSKNQANQVCPYRYYSKPSKPTALKPNKTYKPSEIEKYNKQFREYQTAILEYHEERDYQGFVDGVINRLACVEALNEGHNIPDVDCAFMIQINSNDKDLWQRMGRILRIREGHIGRVIILCVEDTVDAEWVKKATTGLDNTKIRWITLDDLRNGRQTITF